MSKRRTPSIGEAAWAGVWCWPGAAHAGQSRRRCMADCASSGNSTISRWCFLYLSERHRISPGRKFQGCHFDGGCGSRWPANPSIVCTEVADSVYGLGRVGREGVRDVVFGPFRSSLARMTRESTVFSKSDMHCLISVEMWLWLDRGLAGVMVWRGPARSVGLGRRRASAQLHRNQGR